jgi:N-acetylglutamate synthase-like GNAT family acetyltransferase
MEDLLTIEQVEVNFTITEEKILCEHGELEYSFDKDVAIVNSISVYLKRNRIGTKLVSELENLVQQNELKTIEVPVSPTKEAILFWKSLGYKPSSEESKYWINKISRSYYEGSWDILQGVVVMNKQL